MTTSAPAGAPSRATRRLALLATGLALLTLAGWCGAWHWTLDLASHFRCYWLLFAVLMLAETLRRHGVRPAGRWPIACLTVALVGNAWAIAPCYLPVVEPAAPPAARPLAIVALNVWARNRRTERTLAYLREQAADVVVLLEVSAAWGATLEELADLYPHRLVEPRSDNFGIALLSRTPLLEGRVVEFGGTGLPNVVARVRHEGTEVTIVGSHPLPPGGGRRARARDAQLAAIGGFVAAAPGPCIVAGDLNATPWSHAFRRLLADGGLRDTAAGRGVQATWMARLWAPRIPIDHVLVTRGTAVVRRAVGRDVGSDHFPIEAEVVPQARE